MPVNSAATLLRADRLARFVARINEVEEISRDDDQIGLEFIDPRNGARQPIGAEKRADMQVGDVDQLDVCELAWKVGQRK